MEGGRDVDKEVLGPGMVGNWRREMSALMLDVNLLVKIRRKRINIEMFGYGNKRNV